MAVVVSAKTVATIAGTNNKTPANCKTKPKFPKTAFTGGLSNRGAVKHLHLLLHWQWLFGK